MGAIHMGHRVDDTSHDMGINMGIKRDWMQTSNKKLLNGTVCSLNGYDADFIARQSFISFLFLYH